MDTTDRTYDVAIIGGGAAGLSAALVLTRALRSVVVIDAARPRNAPAARMQGFLSRDGMAPSELLAVGRQEVLGYGGELVADTVTDVVRTPTGELALSLASGGSVVARRLLMVTGLRDEVPDLPGVAGRWGRDLLHCPYCHGHEVRDQPLGVLGGAPGAVAHALLVRQWSADVVYFARSSPLTGEEVERLAARGIEVVVGEVARLVVEDDRLTGVELADGRVVPRAAVFVRPHLVPHSALLVALGAGVDHLGWPLVDASGRTTVEDVWAAGNAADPRAQVITAAGQGSAAAIAINNDLVEQDVLDAVLTNEKR
ncbi:NAD(P)/FAD-dependent oxidoreductase [Nocardioides sp. MH1]|uniref:NAD(P)/FAD-dependent oxidoreductase n=1 Tax=Nocardioides sp. MH1 TaxID=3242490 RepID=UPI0035200F49